MTSFPETPGNWSAGGGASGGAALRAPQALGQPVGQALAHGSRLPTLVLMYMFAVLLPVSAKVGPLNLSVLRFVLLATFVGLMLRLISGRCGKLLPVDILFFLHIGWAAVALAVNNPNMVVEQVGSVGLEFLGGYLVGRVCIRSAEEFTALCKLLLVLVLCMLPFTLFEGLTGRPLLLEVLRMIPGTQAASPLRIGGRLGLERVQGTFVHPIHFGLFCSVCLSMVFLGLKDILTAGGRAFGAALSAGSGFFALSSGALLAIFLQLGLFTWGAIFRTVKSRWWLLVGLFALLYVAIDLVSNRTPIRVFMSYATFSPHTAYWRSIIFEFGMQNVWANPIFGLGLNDWARPSYMVSGSMDNYWLVMAVRYGIPGFLLLAVGYLWALFKIIGRDFSGDERLAQIRLAWACTFVGITFTLCTVHIWNNVYSFIFFMFGAGIWLLDAVPSRETETQPAADPGHDTARDANPHARSAAAPDAYVRQALPARQAAPVERAEADAPRYTRFSGPSDETAQPPKDPPRYSQS